MENHGPLHLEKVQPNEEARYYRSPPPNGCDDLTVYLRHLENADTAFGMVRRALEANLRPGLMCIYGDHVPIMAEVYRCLAVPDGKSDYLIWETGRQNRQSEADVHLEVESLGELLLREAGLCRSGPMAPRITSYNVCYTKLLRWKSHRQPSRGAFPSPAP